jgi:hypothetical protein
MIQKSMRNSIVTSISRNRNSAAHCLLGMARNLGSRSWVGIVSAWNSIVTL